MNSDEIIEKVSNYDPVTRGAYAADKRFAHAGPRPPVPPLGGQFTLNDAADTIKTN